MEKQSNVIIQPSNSGISRIILNEPSTYNSLSLYTLKSLIECFKNLNDDERANYYKELKEKEERDELLALNKKKEEHLRRTIALNKIKEFYIRWEKELMTAGLLPSIRNINRSKISLTRQLESKQKALNQWNKTKKILWEGKEPATIKRYYDNLAKEIDEIKGTVQQLDELKYMLSQEGKLASELYFPRMWRPDIIKENIDEFRQILYKYFEQNPTVARWSVSKGKVVLVNMNKLRDPITGAAKSIEERVENTIARILEEGDRMDIDGFITAVFNKQSKFRPFKHRELDIPNHLVAKFIETNIEYVSTTYARRVIPQLKIAQTYGDRFMANRLYELDLYIHTKYITPLEAKLKTLQESLPKLKDKELKKAKKEFKEIDVIAATGGPGLHGGLLIGTTIAKSI